MALEILVNTGSGNGLLPDGSITWTNVALSSVRSIDIHLMVILQKIPQPPIIKINLKITFLKFLSNISGANEFTFTTKLSYDISASAPRNGVKSLATLGDLERWVITQ